MNRHKQHQSLIFILAATATGTALLAGLGIHLAGLKSVQTSNIHPKE